MLNRLVDLMVALDLRFIQDKAEDGSLIYRLDPYVLMSDSDDVSESLF